MVASPNVAFDGADHLTNVVQDLRRQTEETARASRYPFSAGPGAMFAIFPDPVATAPNGQHVANLTVKYGDGPTLLSVMPGKNGQQRFALFDHAGNVILASDDTAGYGLAAPPTAASLFQTAGLVYSNAGTATVMYSGAMPVTNPGLQVQLRISVGGGTVACTAAARYVLTEPTTGYSYSFAEFSASSAANATTLADGPTQAVVLPSSLIGKVLGVRVDARVTAGVGSGNSVASTPIFVLGCSAQAANGINGI